MSSNTTQNEDAEGSTAAPVTNPTVPLTLSIQTNVPAHGLVPLTTAVPSPSSSTDQSFSSGNDDIIAEQDSRTQNTNSLARLPVENSTPTSFSVPNPFLNSQLYPSIGHTAPFSVPNPFSSSQLYPSTGHTAPFSVRNPFSSSPFHPGTVNTASLPVSAPFSSSQTRSGVGHIAALSGSQALQQAKPKRRVIRRDPNRMKCQRCKNQKQGCDGVLPKCGLCTKTNKTCQWIQPDGSLKVFENQPPASTQNPGQQASMAGPTYPVHGLQSKGSFPAARQAAYPALYPSQSMTSRGIFAGPRQATPARYASSSASGSPAAAEFGEERRSRYRAPRHPGSRESIYPLGGIEGILGTETQDSIYPLEGIEGPAASPAYPLEGVEGISAYTAAKRFVEERCEAKAASGKGTDPSYPVPGVSFGLSRERIEHIDEATEPEKSSEKDKDPFDLYNNYTEAYAGVVDHAAREAAAHRKVQEQKREEARRGEAPE